MVNVVESTKERSLIAWMQRHPGTTFFVLILVTVLGNHLSKAYMLKNLEVYKAPAFEDLKVSSGTVILQPFERHSGRGRSVTDGYYLKLKLEDQSHLMLKCYLINYHQAPCYRKNVKKEPSFKSDLAFQNATVRWLPLNDSGKFHGIVYQIEKDNVPLINFDSFVERYKADYEKTTGSKEGGLAQ